MINDQAAVILPRDLVERLGYTEGSEVAFDEGGAPAHG